MRRSVIANELSPGRGGRRRGRDYPPLALSAFVVMAILALLPSSLNLPQANPAQTLEYAPVPPEDENAPDPSGNFSSLGLGSSPTAGEPGEGGAVEGPSGGGRLPGGVGKNPSTKRCVGNPPRQTEDPLSPPCVAYFNGDNFGSTYQGVTRDEIRIVIYVDGGGGCTQQGTSRPGNECTLTADYHDLDEPEGPDEHVWTRMARRYALYFTDRYQTYGRRPHFYVYYSRGGTDSSPEERRADAADSFRQLKPFAAINQSGFSNTSDYTLAMARFGVLVFLGAGDERNFSGVSAEFMRRYDKRMWSVRATIEQEAKLFSTLVCSQVIDRPVTFSGMDTDQRKPRTIGLITDGDQQRPLHAELGKMVKEQITACGAEISAEAVDDNSIEAAQIGMAEFQQKGITTIVWPSGPDGIGFSNAASSTNYFPEVVFSGSGFSDTTLNGQTQAQAFWRNAIGVSAYTRADVLAQRPCMQAAREADPGVPGVDVANFGCALYNGFRLLFTGIQVAGPRLDPASVDKGFHAIPAVRSDDPRVPACFFDFDDYTCTKDGMLQHWDPAGKDPQSTGSPGCMRMIEGGRRYLAGTWPDQDVAANRRADDPCNSQGFNAA